MDEKHNTFILQPPMLLIHCHITKTQHSGAPKIAETHRNQNSQTRLHLHLHRTAHAGACWAKLH